MMMMEQEEEGKGGAASTGFLDVEAEELDDLFSALSRTPEVKIRARGGAGDAEVGTPSGSRGPPPRAAHSARAATRSAAATPARKRAIMECIHEKLRTGNSVEDLIKSWDKAALVRVADDLLDYIVGRSKVLKHEKLLHSFQKAPNRHL
ncbi:hypothetical protein HOP50_03g26340 [Chloropicon primus]|uniref:Uncharacterized protein n=1 Tax=Chloropicon primus TaxID=1764295 RepID=A0A5B8MK89_9CHLO|nr:hypothetical protein A3770_03p26330 [Chloropicon primus]UPQ99327.1 hypothetical protein HOP50_03g26340 [Chloropicon primus]|eukprot:QDZ20115.1 hypothetical protein A3770_03p26330 [Chloropicon primus]